MTRPPICTDNEEGDRGQLEPHGELSEPAVSPGSTGMIASRADVQPSENHRGSQRYDGCDRLFNQRSPPFRVDAPAQILMLSA